MSQLSQLTNPEWIVDYLTACSVTVLAVAFVVGHFAITHRFSRKG